MVRAAVWVGLVVAILGWTSLSYSGQPDPGLREEILFRHFVINSVISFPTSLAVGFLAEKAFELLGGATGWAHVFLVSVVCLVSGYVQWLVALPALIRRWRRRAG
jgi:hypothetical protein